MKQISLPIDPFLPQLLDALAETPCAVVQAPTGAGKTTRVPPALLDSGLAGKGRIIMLEPRRLAARAAAQRMAWERESPLGGEIGYQVRFDARQGPRTRILVVTEGLLVRMVLEDPILESVGAVIFDEFHERSLDSDLALGMVRLVQQTVRPDLRLLVMSATLGSEAISRYLGDCPIVTGEGRMFPVDIRYQPRPLHGPLVPAVLQGIEQVLDQTPGDVLVFLPGLGEIRQVAAKLASIAEQRDLAVLPLHGDLPGEQQDAALLPQPRRKIVLATNVAETSVTVEGITAVVDAGLARLPCFDPGVGLDRLRLVPISRASADQRAGRAGRTRPGVCLRLWSDWSHRSRPEQTEPEIRRVDLAGAVLRLRCLGEKDIRGFPWMEPPREEAILQGESLLRRLGALNEKGVTNLGQFLARLPVHPRIGRLLAEGQRWGHPESVALAAAILAERDPFPRIVDPVRVDGRRPPTSSDVLERVEALEAFEKTGQVQFFLGTLGRNQTRWTLRARDQLLRFMKRSRPAHAHLESSENSPVTAEEALGRSLLAAFPDRLIRRRQPGSRGGVMVGGRGVRLAPNSGVVQAELFLGIEVDAGQTEALVRQASAIQRSWLSPSLLQTTTEVDFDLEKEQVVSRRRVCCEGLVLEETPAALPDGEEVARVLAGAAADHLDRVLPPSDSPAGRFLIRLRCLGDWMPELNWPPLDELALKALLPDLCWGCRSFEDLRRGPWKGILESKLSAVQRQLVEREAPERIPIPSGRQASLTYEVGRPPVLAVRIQEMFGLEDTPRVAAGRVRVLLHLLAPNQRPQQITDDLASFWTNTYPVVRKELRARYPRHAWPEDPRRASAERHPRRRSPR